MALLLAYFNELIPLNTAEIELISAKFHPRLYRKRQYVHQNGDICSYLNFVVRGCLRMYKVDEKGTIHIIQFASENKWINDLGSFHGNSASELSIDALEDTLVLQINYENLISLYVQAPKFDRIFRVLIENSYIALQKRLLQNISSTAEERYYSFLETYPEISNSLPQRQIASFLGITPEFLSRLRKQYSKKS
ncbi:Crp/Fnr family transcriptional regulator [Flavobacterium bizetiae]|jgi:CRP-like cAMP-binding protein|uniref:Crp/Fnr family transcriptional regulator n=1 Tax=Flavobacterium bizetiae TaxID=2704140 RepID=UPI00375768CC